MNKIKQLLTEKRIEKLLRRRARNSKQEILDTQELISLTEKCIEKGWTFPEVGKEQIKSYREQLYGKELTEKYYG